MLNRRPYRFVSKPTNPKGWTTTDIVSLQSHPIDLAIHESTAQLPPQQHGKLHSGQNVAHSSSDKSPVPNACCASCSSSCSGSGTDSNSGSSSSPSPSTSPSISRKRSRFHVTYEPPDISPQLMKKLKSEWKKSKDKKRNKRSGDDTGIRTYKCDAHAANMSRIALDAAIKSGACGCKRVNYGYGYDMH